MRRILGFASFVILVIFLTQIAAAQQDTLPPVNPGGLTGDLLLVGSPTVFRVVNPVINEFIADGYVGQINTDSISAAAGFAQFCNGMADIAVSERLITLEEEDTCIANGRTPIGFPIAADALVVIVNTDNSFAQAVSAAELQVLFSRAISWSDVRADWPDLPVQRFGPATTTSTFSFFADVVFGGETRLLETAIGAQYFEDLQLVVDGVTRNASSVGFLSFADVANEVDVRRLAVDGVAVDEQSVLSGAYALSRPLFLYSSAPIMQSQPQVAGFINYAITNASAFASQVGLFPLRTGDRPVAVTNWLNAVQGETLPTQSGAPATATALALQSTPPPTPTQEVFIEITAEATPETTAAPDEDSAAIPLQEGTPILIAARADLETLASEFLGLSRPVGWSGSLDINSTDLALLIRLDLELLARQVYGDTRPDDWFGPVSSTPLAIAQDIRHDVEVLANAIFAPGVRPAGWSGDDPVLSCDRNTRTLVEILNRAGFEMTAINTTAPDYCQRLAVMISQFSEVNLLPANAQALLPAVTGSLPSDSSGRSAAPITGNVTIDTRFGVGFLDRSAAFKVGVIPEGELVVPIARSYTQFSNMLLVRGAGFVLFVDYLDTTLTREQFRDLPDVDVAGEETFCDPDWCNPF